MPPAPSPRDPQTVRDGDDPVTPHQPDSEAVVPARSDRDRPVVARPEAALHAGALGQSLQGFLGAFDAVSG